MHRWTRDIDRRTWIRRHVIGAALVAVVALVVRTLTGLGEIPFWISFTLPGMAALFAAGTLLAVISVAVEGDEGRHAALRFIDRRPSVLWAVAAVLFLVAAFPFSLRSLTAPGSTGEISVVAWVGNYLLVIVIAVLFVLPAVFGDPKRGLPRRLLGHPAAMWVGTITYGIFLWHFPLGQEVAGWTTGIDLFGSTTLALGLAMMAVSTVAGAASYYIVELPFLRMKEPRRPRGRRRPAEVTPAPARLAPE
jgi:peptidoglycan/LPS O-acetylase OafA/YrhL